MTPYGPKFVPQFALRNERMSAHVVRVALGPIAEFVTAVPVRPNSARRRISPSVSGSRSLLPSASSVQPDGAAIVATTNVARPPPTKTVAVADAFASGGAYWRTQIACPLSTGPDAVA